MNSGRRVGASIATLLGTLACEPRGGATVERAPNEAALAATAPVGAVPGRDLDVYATGTWAEIRVLQRALQSGQTLDARDVDSIAAAATGLSVDSFRSIASGVEAALKARFARAPTAGARLSPEPQSVFALRAAFLDSLRVEKLLLRVRAETRQ